MENNTTKPRLLISFSGGRTSAFMLWWLMNKWEQRGDYDIVVVFANTGKEDEGTLFFVDECAQEFGVDIVWVEGYPSDKGKGWSVVHKVVSYETASRKGEPYEAMIKRIGIPTTNASFCSDQLKRKAIESYLKSIGWKKSSYIKAIGIRHDEPKRYMKTVVVNGKEKKVRIVKKGVIWPLIDWFPVDKVLVKNWWSERGFDLDIHPDDGNCDRCWKKDIHSLCRSAIRKPDSYKWWQDMTDKYGHFNPRGTKLKPPFNFYRGNISPKDIFTLSLLPESEMAAMAKREKLDGCAESCEAFKKVKKVTGNNNNSERNINRRTNGSRKLCVQAARIRQIAMYYLYKLYHKRSGLYYFGATVNPEQRKKYHIDSVAGLLSFAKYNKVRVENMYYRFAKAVISGKDLFRKEPCRSFAFKEMSFDIIDTAETELDIRIKEGNAIKDNISDAMLLNEQKKSHYSFKIKK